MEKVDVFELETAVDSQSGTLVVVGGRENAIQSVNNFLAQYPIFEILNDNDKKRAKEIRTGLNKCIDSIDRRRIDSVLDFTYQFQTECNELKDLFVERKNEFDKRIKDYEQSQKVVVATNNAVKKYTAVIKFTDEKLIKKLTDFCTKNGCELSFK